MLAANTVEKYLVVEIEECLAELPETSVWEHGVGHVSMHADSRSWIEESAGGDWAGIE